MLHYVVKIFLASGTICRLSTALIFQVRSTVSQETLKHTHPLKVVCGANSRHPWFSESLRLKLNRNKTRDILFRDHCPDRINQRSTLFENESTNFQFVGSLLKCRIDGHSRPQIHSPPLQIENNIVLRPSFHFLFHSPFLLTKGIHQLLLLCQGKVALEHEKNYWTKLPPTTIFFYFNHL